MNRIRIVTSDSKIWNPVETYASIVLASQQAYESGLVEIDLLSEGPCCVTSGIDSMLNSITGAFGFDPEMYTIITSNQIPSSQYRERRSTWVELGLAQQLATKSKLIKPTFKKKFAIFISRSNWQRLGLATHLRIHHKDQTAITFHFDFTNDYHISNFGLEELITKDRSVWSDVYNFIQQLPIRPNIMSYPILWNQHAFDLSEQYQDIFCEIVCETYFTGKTFFVTEKTFRCIINRRPFMVQGPKWYLRNLRALGFKTFGQWWNEGYDEDPADARYKTLCYNIDTIAQASTETIKQWYQEMQPVLEHNVQVLQQLTNKKVLETEFFYD